MFDVLRVGDKNYFPEDWKDVVNYIVKQAAFELNTIPTKDPDKLVTFDELAAMVNIKNRSVGMRCKRRNIPTIQHGHSRAIKQQFVPKFVGNK